MDNTEVLEVITSEGQKFYLKANPTRADVKAITRITQSNFYINAETGKPINPSIADLLDSSRKTILDVLLQRVVLADGSEASKNDFADIFDNLLTEDEALIFAKANEVTKSLSDSKKNVTS